MKFKTGASVLAATSLTLGAMAPAFAAPTPLQITIPVDLGIAPLPIIPAQFSGDPGDGGGNGGGNRGGGDGDASTGGDGENNRSNRSAPAIASTRTPANDQATAAIVRQLTDTDDNCGKLNQPYRIDCIAHEYRELAKRLPRRGDYAEARAALDQVASQLERLAKSNRDRGQRRVRTTVTRVGTGAARTRPLSAVKPDTQASANQQARQVLDQGQAILLRSVPAGDPRQAHYQRIARAFDDAAVLLRS